jgi:protein involved in polysaccharide export with SLBB domain
MTLKDGLTLARAIMMAGGVTRQAKSDQVHIYRRTKTGSDHIMVNFDAIKKGKEKDVPLQAYDIVEVRNSSAWSPKNLGDFFLNSMKATATSLPLTVLY